MLTHCSSVVLLVNTSTSPTALLDIHHRTIESAPFFIPSTSSCSFSSWLTSSLSPPSFPPSVTPSAFHSRLKTRLCSTNLFLRSLPVPCKNIHLQDWTYIGLAAARRFFFAKKSYQSSGALCLSFLICIM